MKSAEVEEEGSLIPRACGLCRSRTILKRLDDYIHNLQKPYFMGSPCTTRIVWPGDAQRAEDGAWTRHGRGAKHSPNKLIRLRRLHLHEPDELRQPEWPRRRSRSATDGVGVKAGLENCERLRPPDLARAARTRCRQSVQSKLRVRCPILRR